MIEEALWKLAALAAAVFLLLVAPLMASYERLDDYAYVHLMGETEKFVDTLLERGELTEGMWRIYKKRLEAAGVPFDVSIEHYRRQTLEDGGAWLEGAYDAAILDRLGNGGVFTMMAGDYVYVTARNRSATKAEQVKGLLLGQGARPGTLAYRDGGMVRHDGN